MSKVSLSDISFVKVRRHAEVDADDLEGKISFLAMMDMGALEIDDEGNAKVVLYKAHTPHLKVLYERGWISLKEKKAWDQSYTDRVTSMVVSGTYVPPQEACVGTENVLEADGVALERASNKLHLTLDRLEYEIISLFDPLGGKGYASNWLLRNQNDLVRKCVEVRNVMWKGNEFEDDAWLYCYLVWLMSKFVLKDGGKFEGMSYDFETQEIRQGEYRFKAWNLYGVLVAGVSCARVKPSEKLISDGLSLENAKSLRQLIESKGM